MEQSEDSVEQAECVKEPTERSEQMETLSEQCSYETEHSEPTSVKQTECSKQIECSEPTSVEQTECSKQIECSEPMSVEQTECSVPTSVEQTECSKKTECSALTSVEQMECSKQTEHSEPTFVEQMECSKQTERCERTSVEQSECSQLPERSEPTSVEQTECSKPTERCELTSVEQTECSKKTECSALTSVEQTECPKQTEHSELTFVEQMECSKQTEHCERTSIEQTECSQLPERCEPTSVEQRECSNQTERCELTSVEQTECSKQIERCELTSVEQTECSKQIECSEPTSVEQMEHSKQTEQTVPPKPPKDEESQFEVWSEPWLERFAEQMSWLPVLWRRWNMRVPKPRSKLGFALLRLLGAMTPMSEGDAHQRLARAADMAKEFYKQLRLKVRETAAACLDSDPDEVLRRSPDWVRCANSYLNLVPGVFANLRASQSDKHKKQSSGIRAENAAGARLMRRVVRGVRRVAALHGPTRAAAAAAAARLGDTEERVFALWCGMRKLAMFKLRALLARGDAPTDAGRLSALEWAVADLLIMYDVTLVTEASYQHYEQLSALLGTFHLVQRFDLERPGQRVLLCEWNEASRWYSRNRVQMSAVGLQKRWYELKQDTRRRFLSQMGGPVAPAPLPLHQAIARRYGHVVVAKSTKSWKELVEDRTVAPPTSERGPAPGDPDVLRTKGDDESSDSDNAASGGDDDDITIVEKPLETIDLSEDKNDGANTSEVVSRVPSSDTQVPQATVLKSELPKLEADDSSKETSSNAENTSKNKNASRFHKTKNKSINKNTSRINKTIDVNKEIVDLDAPSPKSSVLRALQELDVSNIHTTILFDSDEEDIKCTKDGEDKANAGSSNNRVANDVNEVESHSDKGSRYRRGSSDSEEGNLVIDCEDSNSVHGERNTDLHKYVWNAIEREMLPEPLSLLPAIDADKPHGSTSKENSVNGETSTAIKNPLLSYLLKTKSIFDKRSPGVENNPKVYCNAKRKEVSGEVRTQVEVTDLVYAARVAEYAKNIKRDAEMIQVDESSRSSRGSRGEQNEEECTIDPKLLMYAAVILRRIDEELPLISRSPTSSPLLMSRLSRESPPPTPPRSTNPRSSPSRSTPPRSNSPCSTPPRSTSPGSTPSRSTPSPSTLSRPNTPIPTAHSHSLFHYFAATLGAQFVYLKRNVPLLKQCKPCSVVLRRVDLEERKGGSRVAKKVELPDIEEVRRNNRSMLTAQVAPLTPRREGYVSSPEPPSCSSDSDWTPDGNECATSPGASHSAEPSGDEADAEAGSPAGPTSAELGQLLNDLLAGGDNGGCNHEYSTGLRGPVSSVYAESCARCAVRALAAPPDTDAQARLQHRLLRRLAPADQPSTTADATSTTATNTTTTTTATTTTGSSAAVSGVIVDISKKTSKPRSRKRPRPPTPPRPLAPRPRSPVDPEEAAREWLRQKNIAAEKFGVKPRSYKRPAPVPQPQEQPATIEPLDTSQIQKEAQNQIHTNQRPSEELARPSEFKIISGPALVKNTQMSIVTLNQTSSAPTLNKTPPTQMSSITLLNKKNSSAPTILNQTTPTPNQVNAPTLFNPNAVADINKKLVKLAPTTEAERGFHPIITNVHSLAKPKTQKPDVYVLNSKKEPKAPQNFVIIPAPQTGMFSQEPEVVRTGESAYVPPPTPMPQVVNVSGSVQLPSVGQGLHLVVSQQGQTNAPLLTNMLNQPNMVINGNLIESVQNQQVNVQSTLQTNFLMSSMPQVGSQPLLVSCPPLTPITPMSATFSQPGVFSSMACRTSQAPPLLVRSVQSGPAGVAQQNVSQHIVALQNVPQQNVLQQNVTQHNFLQQNVAQLNMLHQNVSQPNVTQQNMQQQNLSQQNAEQIVSQRKVPPWNVSQQSVIQHTMLQQTVLQQNVPQQNVPQQSVLQQNVSQQNTLQQNVSQQNTLQQNVSQQNVPQKNTLQHTVSQRTGSQPKAVTPQAAASRQVPPPANPEEPKLTEKSDDAQKKPGRPGAMVMPARLEWRRRALPSQQWAEGRNPATLQVLATGPREPAVWELEGFLLVSAEETPPSKPVYWALRPRTRLCLPGEETEPEPGKESTDGPKSWLKVRSFARLAPEDAAAAPEAREPTPASPNVFTNKEIGKEPTPAQTPAPSRVFVNKEVYQKLSDDPLVYAKVLVAVRGPRACRALLARGAALQLYCLATCELFPLQAEPKEDVSRITLSGDEHVSSALISLAKQLYMLQDSPDPETPKKPKVPEENAGKQARIAKNRNTVEKALDCPSEPEAGSRQPAKRPRNSGDTVGPAGTRVPAPKEATTPAKRPCPAERRMAPKPPPPKSPAPYSSTAVIELSDED